MIADYGRAKPQSHRATETKRKREKVTLYL